MKVLTSLQISNKAELISYSHQNRPKAGNSGIKSLGLSPRLCFSGKLQNYSKARQETKALQCF